MPGVWIREPVTTTSATSADAPWAWAWVASRAAPQIIDVARRRSRMDFIFKIYPPTGLPLWRQPGTGSSFVDPGMLDSLCISLFTGLAHRST
jgi:hypothetical protein